MVNRTQDLKLKLGLSLKDIIKAVNELNPDDKELFIETLLAATSPEYLMSISKARQEYEDGRVYTFDQVFPERPVKG